MKKMLFFKEKSHFSLKIIIKMVNFSNDDYRFLENSMIMVKIWSKNGDFEKVFNFLNSDFRFLRKFHEIRN